MKKLFLLAFLLIATFNANAFHPLKSSEINNENLSKETCWELIKLWVASDMDTRNAYIAYENWETGKVLIKGEYKDTSCDLQAVENNFVRPYISYEIEIFCADGHLKMAFTKARYHFKAWAGNPYSLDDFTLKRCINEMNEIKDVMYIKGDVWDMDKYFKERESELDKLAEEAKAKMNDESIKKKQRAAYRDKWMEYSSRSSVHHKVTHSVHNLVMSTFKLHDRIKSTL